MPLPAVTRQNLRLLYLDLLPLHFYPGDNTDSRAYLSPSESERTLLQVYRYRSQAVIDSQFYGYKCHASSGACDCDNHLSDSDIAVACYGVIQLTQSKRI